MSLGPPSLSPFVDSSLGGFAPGAFVYPVGAQGYRVGSLGGDSLIAARNPLLPTAGEIVRDEWGSQGYASEQQPGS
jgi:hypothetical protein